MATRRSSVLTLATVGALILLTGCTSPKQDLQTECRQAVADHVQVTIHDVQITWSNETPGGSLDWRGAYTGGEFACGAGLNPDELYQVIVYTADGNAEVVVD